MSTDTPRTDAVTVVKFCVDDNKEHAFVEAEESKKLERELTAANAEIAKLIELGNALRNSCSKFGTIGAEYEWPRSEHRIKAWDAAVDAARSNHP